MHLLDRLITDFDAGLRTVFAPAHASRVMPGSSCVTQDDKMSDRERRESVRLMRVNHCGEVCAQALYQGQALVARAADIRDVLTHAAAEERDHLAWCEQRITSLGGRKSVLNPVWYVSSYGLGLVSGLLGDRWSMGFLVETEKQVEAHLHEYIEKLPASDVSSREVLEVMREDEVRHAQSGRDHGAAELPAPIKGAMSAVSRLMTRTTYWV